MKYITTILDLLFLLALAVVISGLSAWVFGLVLAAWAIAPWYCGGFSAVLLVLFAYDKWSEKK